MASLACMPALDQRRAYDDPLSSVLAVILVSLSYNGGKVFRNMRVWVCVYHAGQLFSNDHDIRVKFEVRDCLSRETWS